ncbi:AraC family L-rhamnose operon transcriptional activator RhaR [Paenibacillus taihuensis]|uniref:AraC family L-rhamnose operon transcriptional activator RhaR n=1 Tax=Paenibacillus taihuensis TaxID=1156355 RepID=A0A3D9R5V0_9BACL|nr:AraC family transcriptional regulator [Paenibacillus taihuensis]REE70483.1 AraC family L-rhamnose operon transcriptional activator RhaR [Paenibacillus taihuensis]
MYLWNESDTWLNQYALRLKSSDAVFNVHYWGVNEQLTSNFLHKHSFFEICYVLGGQGTYTDNGTTYELRSGTMFCSRPGINHTIQCDPTLAILYVAFELDESSSPETVRAAFQAMAVSDQIVVYDGDNLPAAQLWRSIIRRSGDAPSLPEAVLPQIACSLLLALPGVFADSLQVEWTAPRRSSSALLKQAKLFITDNLSDDELSLEKVAAQINLSPRHLSRLFSSGVYESYTNYVRKQRVRKAAEMLRYSELSIKEIAEKTGFGSVHYFTRTFSALMHVTPARFREESQTHD